MICDVHAHYIPMKFSDFMGDRFPPRVGVPTRPASPVTRSRISPCDIQGRLDLMDAAGVETQILSPHRQPYLPDETECVQALGICSTMATPSWRRGFHNVSRSYVMLPLPHIDASLREMDARTGPAWLCRRQYEHLVSGRSIADAKFEPIFAEMNRRGTILFVHPSVTGVCSPVINDWGFRARSATPSRTRCSSGT